MSDGDGALQFGNNLVKALGGVDVVDQIPCKFPPKNIYNIEERRIYLYDRLARHII